MTRDVTPDLLRLRLLSTSPHPCSYLPGRVAVTRFVDPAMPVDVALHSELSRLGFRRSGRFYYAPGCPGCRACLACRIVVGEFRLTRAFARTLRRGGGLERRLVARLDEEEHYPLFEAYIAERHRDGDMYPPSREQFREFLAEGVDGTRYLEFREGGRLLGCAVIDFLDDGLSAVYTYFAPEAARLSPGTLAILCQIELARQQGLPYVYLGYWIRECRKMSYKARFAPLEILTADGWSRLSAAVFSE
ncbi:MAG: putative arginyl-tRNA--protein transferase [Porticoccaceae bacterium]|nr:MAG: putative arginyl-tRNA--protein transferase [Porticoccaceae bacterium]